MLDKMKFLIVHGDLKINRPRRFPSASRKIKTKEKTGEYYEIGQYIG